MNKWLDFKMLRANLKFEDVLQFYNIEVKRKGNQHHGFCPLPNHNGKKNSPSFSANLERGIFHCFGCGAKGNLLEFAALMEKVSLHDGSAFREVALKLQERFCPGLGDKKSNPSPEETAKKPPPDETPVIENATLDFELKGLDADHPYLLSRGFTAQTTKHFGLGFCSRGMLKDRLAIPLHDNAGRLVGYGGRIVDDSKISDKNPRYLLPGERKRDGKLYHFRKTLFVYNGFRIRSPVAKLVVVESFTSVWWLTQNNIPDAVGTMGSDCSERQAELIVSYVKPDGHIWILSDGDPAGHRHAEVVLRLVSPHRFVRWVKLPEGKQPTDLSSNELQTNLS